MGGFWVEYESKLVTMPFGEDWTVPTLEGRFPNEVMLMMDEARFKRSFESRAIWIQGAGEFATLSYCGEGLTIQRHRTLESAIEAKRAIDGGGCGGGCAKVHIIVGIDPKNSRHTREQENIRQYVAAGKAK
jgi:hypothetical protein